MAILTNDSRNSVRFDEWCPNEVEAVIAHHAEQRGKQGHVAGSARSISAPGVRGHPQDVPCQLLVARTSLNSLAQQFDPANPDRMPPITFHVPVIDVAIHAALVLEKNATPRVRFLSVSVKKVKSFAEIVSTLHVPRGRVEDARDLQRAHQARGDPGRERTTEITLKTSIIRA